MCMYVIQQCLPTLVHLYLYLLLSSHRFRLPPAFLTIRLPSVCVYECICVNVLSGVTSDTLACLKFHLLIKSFFCHGPGTHCTMPAELSGVNIS